MGCEFSRGSGFYLTSHIIHHFIENRGFLGTEE
jgi:hypothetical protein